MYSVVIVVISTTNTIVKIRRRCMRGLVTCRENCYTHYAVVSVVVSIANIIVKISHWCMRVKMTCVGNMYSVVIVVVGVTTNIVKNQSLLHGCAHDLS